MQSDEGMAKRSKFAIPSKTIVTKKPSDLVMPFGKKTVKNLLKNMETFFLM